jgi:hypothetical protein
MEILDGSVKEQMFLGTVLNATGSSIATNDLEVHGTANVVTGNRCTVVGPANSVSGERCSVYGSGCSVSGAHCRVEGDDCAVSGDHCTVRGRNCAVTGKHCTYESVAPAAYSGPGASMAAAMKAFAGRQAPTPPADQKVWHTDDGGTVVCDGLTGSISINYSGASRRNAKRIREEGRHRTDEMPLSVALSAALGRKDDKEAKKKRKDKPKLPEPWDKEPEKAAEPGRECLVCMERASATRVKPCRHLCMCVRCARQVGKPEGAKCPACQKRIERIVRV